MGSNGARNTSDDKAGGSTYSAQLKNSKFIERAATKSNKDIESIPFSSAKLIGGMFQEQLAKGAKYNARFFANEVIGKKGGIYENIEKTNFQNMSEQKKDELYAGYVSDRNSGKRDPFGRDIVGGKGENNKPTVIKKNINGNTITTTAPTTVEVAQATATDATDTTSSENILLKKKKAKATGRSSTILTSSKGVTSDQGLTLGKKSLLGA